MKAHVWISPCIFGNARSRILPLLRDIEPKVAHGGGLVPVVIPDGDDRGIRLLNVFREHGVRQWVEGPSAREIENSPNGYFMLKRIHGYDDSDLARAEYFWLLEMDGGEWDLDTDGERHADGMLAVLAQSIPKRGQLMSSGPETFFVSAAFKEELEAEQFVGLQFKPTKQVRDKYVKGEYVLIPHEPPAGRVMWEICPTVSLPRMHPEVTRLPPFNGGAYTEPGPGRFKNEGFDDVQLVYPRSAFQQAGSFDIALTWEFTCRADQRPHIVSQRFYQFCKAKKIQARFIPVKIVEGE